MALQGLIRALYGHYEPTGAYSFEFRRTKGGQETMSETYLLLPPESVIVTENPRSDLIPTIGGGYLVDFGNDFKQISVSLSSHFFYVGTTDEPSKQLGRSFDVVPDNFIDGFSEFVKLRYLLTRYRDYTLSPDSHVKIFDFSQSELYSVNALQEFVRAQVEDGDGALIDEVELVWHDYDYDDHYKVKVDKFVASRDKADPWTVKMDIELTAYQTDDRSGTVTLQSPSLRKLPEDERIRNAMILTSGEMPATFPEELLFEDVSGENVAVPSGITES